MRALLLAIHRSVRPLGTGDHVDVMTWLREARPDSPEAFRAGLASLLARDSQEWDRIAALVDQAAAGTLDSEGHLRFAAAVPTAVPTAVSADPAPRSPVRPATMGRLWRLMHVLRARWILLAAIAASLLLVAGLTVLWVSRGSPPLDPAPPALAEPAATASQTAEVKTEATFSVASELRQVPFPWLPEWSWARLAGLAGLSLGLLVLGWYWRHVEGPALERREREREKDDEASHELRVALEEERAARGDGPLHLYAVQTFTPLEPWALADSAELLGDLHRWSGGRSLDVDQTVRRTAAAGDEVVPVFQARAVAVPTVVLVDLESGEHPWSGRIQRLIEAWRRQGVPLLVYTFQRDPQPVRDDTGTPLTLAELGRRTEGLPLLIFSRALSPVGRDGPRPWPQDLGAWPRRAWVDPEPLALTDPRRVELTEALRDLGLVRFPFSEQGLLAAIRALRDEPSPPVADPGLPPRSMEEVEDALELWAVAAAQVPEPTWDQCEAIRREHTLLREVFPGPHAVAWLIRWMEALDGNQGRGVADRGDRLFMAPGNIRRLLDLGVDRASREPPVAELLHAMNDLLLRQLGPEAPQGPLASALWQLKVHLIRARQEPERAAELLLPLVAPDSPYRAVALEQVTDELRRRRRSGEISGQDVEILEGAVGAAPGLQIWDLVPRHWAGLPPWRRALAWTAALALGWALVGFGAPWLKREVGLGLSTPGELPAVRALATRKVWLENERRPDMVEIKPGTFTMGSPETEEGRDDDEEQHKVTISKGFALARTEVTQAMYRAVMGEDPSCADYQGTSLLGDTLPVQCVSWFDAIRYCNRLSELEGLKPAYTVNGEDVTWNPDADGYRLPTEAEWEYAARAGTSDAYAGTSSADDVCRYGNVADATAKKSFPDWDVFSCDDGFAGLAPVGKFNANAWGLHDLTGNVWEWVWDRYDSKYSISTDPRGPEAGSYRVYRGGSWWHYPRGARVALRGYIPSAHRGSSLGFRPARSLPSAL